MPSDWFRGDYHSVKSTLYRQFDEVKQNAVGKIRKELSLDYYFGIVIIVRIRIISKHRTII